MQLKQVGVLVGIFAGLAASAALVRWPYDIVAEAILALSALAAAASLVAWLIGLFYDRVPLIYQKVTLIASGTTLGAYLAVAAAYFTGFLRYNYPASQAKIFAQAAKIETLTSSVSELEGKLKTTTNELGDATKAMVDPNSISTPSYNLPTSLKLQFDNNGNAQAIETHNVVWHLVSVPQAKETGTVAPAPEEVKSDKPAVDCSNVVNLGDPGCRSFGLLQYGSTCPKMACPAVTKYETSAALVMLLSFPYPIQASKINLSSHGANIPDNKTLSLSERNGAIFLEARPTNLVLDVDIVQAPK